MVNDMTIIYGLLVFFVTLGLIVPFINDEFHVGMPEFSAESLSKDMDELDVKSSVSAFEVIGSIGSMFFWGFDILPAFINGIIFIPLRIIFWVTLGRNVWIGGGG